MRRLFLVIILLASATAAAADDTCRALIADLGNQKQPGLYIPADQSLQHWRPIRGSEIVSVTTTSIPIGYIRRGNHPGVVVVKIIKTTNNPDARTQIVNLRRRDDIQQCGVSTITTILWRIFSKSYENGAPVSVADYIQYHRERTPNADIERFHIQYTGRDNVCTRTDDPNNGNREQFLFDDKRTPIYPLSAVAGNIGFSNTALAYDGGSLSIASFAETLIADYTAEAGCASFEFHMAGQGSYILRLNDLEARNGHGKRLKAEFERRFTVGH